MFKSKEIKESDLPLRRIGEQEGTYRVVYELTRSLDSSLSLSLKCNGYVQENIKLHSGDIVRARG